MSSDRNSSGGLIESLAVAGACMLVTSDEPISRGFGTLLTLPLAAKYLTVTGYLLYDGVLNAYHDFKF